MRPIAPLLAFGILAGAPVAYALDNSVFVEEVRCVGGRLGLTLPSDVRILKKLSKVLREEIGEVEKWEGYTAIRKTIHFDGMSIGIVEFSNDPARYMVTSAEITGAAWNRISPFKLRGSVAAAVALIGEPAKTDPALQRSYGSESDNVMVQSASGVITRVYFECYSG